MPEPNGSLRCEGWWGKEGEGRGGFVHLPTHTLKGNERICFAAMLRTSGLNENPAEDWFDKPKYCNLNRK